MNRKLLSLSAAALLLAAATPFAAQEITEQDAIDLALTAPDCRNATEGYEDWKARAYDSENPWHIWHVEFRNSEGNDLGYADVSVVDERVYHAECYFGPTDEQLETAQPILEAFLSSNDEILALLDDVEEHEMYIDFDGYNNWWGVYIANDPNSLYVTVRFAEPYPSSLDDPQLIEIHFSDMPSYDEWFGSTSQQAVVVAFADRQVADVLAKDEGWTTDIEHVQGSVWKVNFMQADRWLGSATVDVNTREVLERATP